MPGEMTPLPVEDMPDKWADVREVYKTLQRRYPHGFPFNRNDVRLGIAALEDETAEVWKEWDNKKHNLDHGAYNLREELLQVAAVAMMIVEGIDGKDVDR
jgi:hypothetical protein